MAGYLSGEDIEEIADYQRCKAELTRLRSDLEKAIEALKHAQRNMPHPDQMIDDTLSQLENSK